MSKLRCFSNRLISNDEDRRKYDALVNEFVGLGDKFLYSTVYDLDISIGIIQQLDNNLEIPSVERVRVYYKDAKMKEGDELDEHGDSFVRDNYRHVKPSSFVLHYKFNNGKQEKRDEMHSKLMRMFESAFEKAGIDYEFFDNYGQFLDKYPGIIERKGYVEFDGTDGKGPKGLFVEANLTDDGKPMVVIFGNRVQPDTAIHEYTHVWIEAMRRLNPKLWRSIRSAFVDNNGEIKDVNIEGQGLYIDTINEETKVEERREAKTLWEFAFHVRKMYDRVCDKLYEGPGFSDYIVGEVIAHMTEQIGMNRIFNKKGILESIDKIENENEKEDENRSKNGNEVSEKGKVNRDVFHLKGILKALKDFWEFIIDELFASRKKISETDFRTMRKFDRKNPTQISNYILHDLLNATQMDISKQDYTDWFYEFEFDFKADKNSDVVRHKYIVDYQGNNVQVVTDEGGTPIDINNMDDKLKSRFYKQLDIMNHKAVIVQYKGKDYIVDHKFGIYDYYNGTELFDKLDVNDINKILSEAGKIFNEKGYETSGFTNIGSTTKMRMKMLKELLNDKKLKDKKELKELARSFAVQFSTWTNILQNDLYYVGEKAFKKYRLESVPLSSDEEERRKQILENSEMLKWILIKSWEAVIGNSDKNNVERIKSLVGKHSSMIAYLANDFIKGMEGYSLFDHVNVFSAGFAQIGHNISYNYLKDDESKTSIGTKTTTSEDDELEEFDEAVEEIKEGWMYKQNEHDVKDDISPVIWRLCNMIVGTSKQENGTASRLDADEVHQTLLSIVSGCETSDEMLPALLKAKEKYPWIEQWLEILGGRKNRYGYNNFWRVMKYMTPEQINLRTKWIQSLFWKDFHKARTDFESVVIDNDPDAGQGYSLRSDAAQNSDKVIVMRQINNFESGDTLNDNSFYTRDRKYNREKAQQRIDLYEKISLKPSDFKDKEGKPYYDEDWNVISNNELDYTLSEQLVNEGAKAYHEYLESLGFDFTEYDTDRVYRDVYVNGAVNKERLNAIENSIKEYVSFDRKEIKGTLGGTLNSKDALRKRLIDNNKGIVSLLGNVVTSEAAGFAVIRENGETPKRMYNHSKFNELHKLFDIILKDAKKTSSRFLDKWWYYKSTDISGKNHSFNAWIEEIVRGRFSPVITQIGTVNGKTFDNMYEDEIYTSEIAVYAAGKKVLTTNFADAKNRFAINVPFVLRNTEDFAERSVDLVLQELKRISVVNARANDSKLSDDDKIENFDTGEGVKFHYFKGLNDEKTYNRLVGLYAKVQEDDRNVYNIDVREEIKQILLPVIGKEMSDYVNALTRVGVLARKSGYPEPRYGHAGDDANGSILDAEWVEWVWDSLDDKEQESLANDIRAFIAKVNPRIHHMMGLRTKEEVVGAVRDTVKFITEFYCTSSFHTRCINDILFGDMAFGNGATDIQKRIKQVYTPVDYAYTSHFVLRENQDGTASFVTDVSGYSQQVEYFITLEDEEVDLNGEYGELFDRLESLNDDDTGKITASQNADIKAGMRDVKYTDGQTYRSLESRQRVDCMTGNISDIERYNAISKALRGEQLTEAEERKAYIDTQKAFVSTSVNVGNMAVGADSKYATINARTQHKNSEFTLLDGFSQFRRGVQSEKLAGLSMFMNRFGVSKANFVSVEKVGAMARNINISSSHVEAWYMDRLKGDTAKKLSKEDRKYTEDVVRRIGNGEGLTRHDYMHYLGAVTGLAKDFGEKDTSKMTFEQKQAVLAKATNRNVVKSVSMNDWGITTPHSQHFNSINRRGLSTQFQTMVVENIPDNAEIKLKLDDETSDVVLTGKQVRELYYKAITQQILKGFTGFSEKFINARQLQVQLAHDALSNKNYSEDLMYYLELDASNSYFLHPWNPQVAAYFEKILSAKFKRSVQKRAINLQILPQVSCFGYEDKLGCRFKDQNGNMLLNRDEFETGNVYDPRQQAWCDYIRNKYIFDRIENKKFQVEEHRSFVRSAYDEYRKEHLKSKMSILYFETAMSPYAFTDKLGGEKDVDSMMEKLSPMTREYIGYRIPFEAKHSGIPCFVKFFLPEQNAACVMLPKEWIGISDSDNDDDKLYSMIREAVSKYNGKGDGRKLKSVSPLQLKAGIKHGDDADTVFGKLSKFIEDSDTGMAAINNLIIDISQALMQSDFNTGQIFTAGGFPKLQKIGAALQEALEGNPTDERLAELSRLEGLGKIKADANANVSDPTYKAMFYHRNATARKLIGIYAVERAFKSFFSLVDMRLNDTEGVSLNGNRSLPKDLNGNDIISLSTEKNAKGEYVTDNQGEFLGAAVDGVKKPILTFLGQNDDTAALTMMLTSMGYSLDEAAYFVSMPCVQDVFRAARMPGKSLAKAIQEKVSEYETIGYAFNANNKKMVLTSENMFREIGHNAQGKALDMNVETAALHMMQKLSVPLDWYTNIILNNRFHTGNSIKNDPAENMLAKKKIDALNTKYLNMKEEKRPFRDMGVFFNVFGYIFDEDGPRNGRIPYKPDLDVKKSRQVFLDTYKMAMLDGMRRILGYASMYGKVSTNDFKYGESFGKLVDRAFEIADSLGNMRWLNARDIRGLETAYGLYAMSNILYGNGDKMPQRDRRAYLIGEFPELVRMFKRMARKDRSFPGKALLDNLWIADDTLQGIDYTDPNKGYSHGIRGFRFPIIRVGGLSDLTVKECKEAWRELLASDRKMPNPFRENPEFMILFQQMRAEANNIKTDKDGRISREDQNRIDEAYENEANKYDMTTKEFAQRLLQYHYLRSGYTTSQTNRLLDMFPMDMYAEMPGYNTALNMLDNMSEDDIERVLDQYVAHRFQSIRNTDGNFYKLNLAKSVRLPVDMMPSEYQVFLPVAAETKLCDKIALKKFNVGDDVDGVFPKYLVVDVYKDGDTEGSLKPLLFKLRGTDRQGAVYSQMSPLGKDWNLQEYAYGEDVYQTEFNGNFGLESIIADENKTEEQKIDEIRQLVEGVNSSVYNRNVYDITLDEDEDVLMQRQSNDMFQYSLGEGDTGKDYLDDEGLNQEIIDMAYEAYAGEGSSDVMLSLAGSPKAEEDGMGNKYCKIN